MRVLVFGSDSVPADLARQPLGLRWNCSCAETPDEVLDYAGTHDFNAMIVGVTENTCETKEAVSCARDELNVPIVIGICVCGTDGDQTCLDNHRLDVVLTDCASARVLKLQCDALIRFANGRIQEDIVCGDVTYHTVRDAFSVGGCEVHLPTKKHKLLQLLFFKRGHVVTTEMVLNHLYGWDEPPNTKIVDVFVCQIRRTLREAGASQDVIHTLWGRGYTIKQNSERKATSRNIKFVRAVQTSTHAAVSTHAHTN